MDQNRKIYVHQTRVRAATECDKMHFCPSRFSTYYVKSGKLA
jgi:hypothetical protein